MQDITTCIPCIICAVIIIRCILLERKLSKKDNFMMEYTRFCMNVAGHSIYHAKGEIPECEEDILNLDDEVTFTLAGIRHYGWIEMAESTDPLLIDAENPFEIAYICDGETEPRYIRIDFVENLKLLRHKRTAPFSRYNSYKEQKEHHLL